MNCCTACQPKYIPNPIRERPDITETAVKNVAAKYLRKVLAKAAIAISQHKIPVKIAQLYKISCPVSYVLAVLAKTEP